MGWTVSRRIALGFALGLGLSIVLAVVGVTALRKTDASYANALSQERNVLVRALNVRSSARNANIAYLRFFVTGETANRTVLDTAARNASSSLTALAGNETEPNLRQTWTDASARLADWTNAITRMLDVYDHGDKDGALKLRSTEVAPLRIRLDSVLERGATEAQLRTDSIIAQSRNAAHGAQNALWIGLLIALVAGIASAVALTRSITKPLQETSNVLATTAAEILATTTQQASGATESLAAVTETAATVDEVVQTSEQAAERAKMVVANAQRAAESGVEGKTAVDESVASMALVQEQVEAIGKRILALADQAQAIGEIISTVNDLADQTNLLALNAAIEAARAGEQGRGFAVVAAEIRDLAEQSKGATVRVRDILSEIQRATNAAVLSTEQGNKLVAEGTSRVNVAGQKIKALADVVASSSQAAIQIAASAGQQAAGMSQIRQAISNIQDAAQQNLSATREAETASQELNRLGERLIALVGAERMSKNA